MNVFGDTMKRRDFLILAAAQTAIAADRTRKTGKVETVFKSPGPKPNGLQATDDGLWIIDQGNNRAYLVNYSDGKVTREFNTAADRASGIGFDGEAIWLASTYSREIIRADARTGKTLAKYFTPGAGVIYRMPTDPPGRISPLEPMQSIPPQQQPMQKQNSRPRLGTGAHGLEWREGKLWVAVPPSRSIYCINPRTWVVESKFSTAGNRPHGIGWEGKWLWCTDSNMNAFYKHDPETGDIMEKIQLAEADPLPHGMTIWRGAIWYCDDVGVVCRLTL